MRLRLGELIAGTAAAGFTTVAFLDWFETAGTRASGWNAFSAVVLVFVAVALAGTAALVVTTAVGKPVAWPVGLGIVTTFTSIFGALVLLGWLAFGPEVDGAGADARWPAFAGTILFLAIPAGTWKSMQDERLDAPGSAYEPPPARPVPGSDS